MILGKLIQYLFLILVGFLLMLLVSIIIDPPSTPLGAYHYTFFLKNNFGLFAWILFFIAGLAIGYLMNLITWLVGFCLILIFPICFFYEVFLYRGSLAVIPIDFLFTFLFPIPSILGSYFGKWLSDRIEKSN